MTLPDFPVEGGCLCRAVRFRIAAPPLGVYSCHCKDCQRTSGGTHTMSMPTKREHVVLLCGDLASFDKRADSGRVVRMVFCPHCATKLWNEPLSAPDILIVKPGTLDDMRWAAPAGNIWTASRAPWAEIDESLVNFAGQPTDRQPLYDAWRRAQTDG
jgi:hypothetical protein